MVVFTDGISTARALTTGSSDAPKLNFSLRSGCNGATLGGVQFLGIHGWFQKWCWAADGLSRDKAREVIAEAAAAGAVTVELAAQPEAWQALS